jgi:hypothetical protein
MIENLGIHDTEELARFLLYHVSTETRRLLRQEMPVLYKRLYPDVSVELLVRDVTDAVNSVPTRA